MQPTNLSKLAIATLATVALSACTPQLQTLAGAAGAAAAAAAGAGSPSPSVSPGPAASASPTSGASSSPTSGASAGPVASATGGPGVPGPLPFTDDFSNPNTLAANWIITDAPNASGKSEWKVTPDGMLAQNSNIFRSDNEYDYFEGSTCVTRTGTNWTDYIYTVSVKPSDNDGTALLFRYQDENNFYRVLNVNDAGNKGPMTRFDVKQNGVYKTLAKLDTAAFTNSPSTLSHVQITARGSHLTVVIDGKQLFDLTDTTFPSGRVGMQVYAEEGVNFDDVTVTGL